MINFFRGIRKKLADDNPPSWRAGKPLKYMRYAIGEIVLVVVRILIAEFRKWSHPPLCFTLEGRTGLNNVQHEHDACLPTRQARASGGNKGNNSFTQLLAWK